MGQGNYAVITGDMVDSTTIAADFRESLKDIAKDIQMYIDQNTHFDIFRGDSFQLLVPQPKVALLVALLFRTGLRRHSNGSGIDDTWDARVSIGIGTINQEPSSVANLGSMDGEAFLRSGRTLDVLKREGAFLKVTTGDRSLDESLSVCTSLADAIIGRWSTIQAHAIYLYLLRGLTQKEIGKMQNVSQRAIGQRLESAQFHNLQPFLKYFERIV